MKASVCTARAYYYIENGYCVIFCLFIRSNSAPRPEERDASNATDTIRGNDQDAHSKLYLLPRETNDSYYFLKYKWNFSFARDNGLPSASDFPSTNRTIPSRFLWFFRWFLITFALQWCFFLAADTGSSSSSSKSGSKSADGREQRTGMSSNAIIFTTGTKRPRKLWIRSVGPVDGERETTTIRRRTVPRIIVPPPPRNNVAVLECTCKSENEKKPTIKIRRSRPCVTRRRRVCGVQGVSKERSLAKRAISVVNGIRELCSVVLGKFTSARKTY